MVTEYGHFSIPATVKFITGVFDINGFTQIHKRFWIGETPAVLSAWCAPMKFLVNTSGQFNSL